MKTKLVAYFSLSIILAILFSVIYPSQAGVLAAPVESEGPVSISDSPIVSPAPQGETKAAGAGWYDGVIKYSTITNCISIIQGNPYTELGAGTYVGYFANPGLYQPIPGMVYYVHVVIYGLGNACSGMYAYVDIGLPPNTTLAISATNPVYCFANGVLSTGCPQTLPESTYNTGFYMVPSTAVNQTWPLPQGGNWEFQIPVVSSTPLTNGTLQAAVFMLDGNSSPWLNPTQGVYVYSSPVPGTFNKTSPANAAINLPANPNLSWGSSSGAASYEYCLDTVNDNVCNTSWVSTGANTSVGLSGLPAGIKYWQVRAKNTSGNTLANNGTWWSFTVAAKPGAFSKTSPVNLAIGRPINIYLKWGVSANATKYEYCIDTSNNNVCNTSWKSTGTKTSVYLTGLLKGTKYYWQVRAKNVAGTKAANAGKWWVFTTNP